MEIKKTNLKEMLNTEFDGKEVYTVDTDCIVDAGINPREIDVKYAEQIPLSVPPINLGIIKEDDELKDKLIIIDGNHRLYSVLNVHCINHIKACINVYRSRSEAIIDAYKFNVNHGKRLSDKEIATGIKKIAVLLRGEDKDSGKTYTELSKLLNLSLSSIYEYVAWDKVENVLGEKIDKLKAAKIFFILKEDDGVNKLRRFWSLNKNLSFRKIKEAARLYRETGVISDYEQYRANQALLEDDDEDGIENETIIKPVSLSGYYSKVDDTDDNDTDGLNEFHELPEDKDVDDEDEEEGYNYVSKTEEIEEGRPVEIIKTNKKYDHVKETETDIAEETNDNLVQVKGLVRKFAFDTVVENIFNDLQEDVLNANSLLQETLEKYLHKNRDLFEKHKGEYLAILNNCNLVLAKMEKVLNRANKDYKE